MQWHTASHSGRELGRDFAEYPIGSGHLLAVPSQLTLSTSVRTAKWPDLGDRVCQGLCQEVSCWAGSSQDLEMTSNILSYQLIMFLEHWEAGSGS